MAVIKQLWAVDIAGAEDVSNLSGQSTLLTKAVPKQLFLDLVPVLVQNGVTTSNIPAKIEGLAFGKDVTITGVVNHTLYVGNDNDFVPDVAGPNRWYVFGFTDEYLASLNLSYVPQQLSERGADLAVSKTAASASALTGTNIDYTLTVANNGYLPADGVLLAHALPAGLSLVACASSGSCNGSTVSFASLPANNARTATITAQLSCALADGAQVVNNASGAFASEDPTPADNKLNTVKVSYEVADNCAGTACTLSVSANEGSSTDWSVIDAHTVQLRASRNGNGPGRTYSIPVTCVDSGGAVSVAQATVFVPHDQQ